MKNLDNSRLYVAFSDNQIRVCPTRLLEHLNLLGDYCEIVSLRYLIENQENNTFHTEEGSSITDVKSLKTGMQGIGNDLFILKLELKTKDGVTLRIDDHVLAIIDFPNKEFAVNHMRALLEKYKLHFSDSTISTLEERAGLFYIVTKEKVEYVGSFDDVVF